MKKVFIQIRQRILKHRKRLIYGALAFFVGQICFFGLDGLGFENEVFAEDNSTQNDQFTSDIKKKTNSADFYYKFMYVIAYPVIFLAAKLVDNSFVYGEVFGFDAVLRELRNIIKNLANFTLGFIFVYKIFTYLIANFKGGNPKDNPKRIITRALVAGIGIQASRFIMGILIDISTVLIYGIGGLPISILSSTMEEKEPTSLVSQNYDPHMLKTVVSLDVSDFNNLNVYWTNIGTEPGKFYISECEIYSFQHENGDKQPLLLAPKMIYYKEGRGKGEYHRTVKTACSYYGKIYRFSNLYEGLKRDDKCQGTGCEAAQMVYNESKSRARQELDNKKNEIISLVNDGQILEIGNAHIEDGIIGGVKLGARIYGKDEHIGLDIDNDRPDENNTKKLSEVLQDEEKTNSYVGVFTSLYASLLQEGQGATIDGTVNPYVQYLNALLKLFHILAIIIPLAVAAIVFMMRIGIIWMAIVLSPMIALFTAFGLFEKIKSVSKHIEYFEIKNLIGIIFAPAIICFAISMSTVLVTIIEKINTQHIDTNEEWILGGLIKLDVAGLSLGVGKLIIAVIGVAITWFLVWEAVQWSKLGEGENGIIGSLRKMANAAIGSTPIIPIPTREGAQMIGANKFFGLNGETSLLDDIKTKALSEYGSQDREVSRAFADDLFNNNKGGGSGGSNGNGGNNSGGEGVDPEKNLYMKYNNILLNDPTATNGDWTTHEFDLGNNQKCTFGNLTINYQKQIIEDINEIKNVETRKKFGTAQPTVTVGTGNDTMVYEFDNSESRYQVKTS